MGLRYDEISEILKLIDGSSCDEFVLETEDIKLVVRRRGANSHVVETRSDQGTIFVGQAKSAQRPQTIRSAAHAPSAHVVSAPMVGTFYRSPSPGAPPFVEIGSNGQQGRPDLHHRGHETVHDNSRRMERHSQGDRSGKRAARRIRPDAVRHRTGITQGEAQNVGHKTT